MWDLLPENKRIAVEKAVQTTFGNSAMDNVTPLTDGLSGAVVYKLIVGGKAYVMRVTMSFDEVRDPVRHYTCLQLASDGGVTPHVAYISVEDGVSIVDFTEAKPLAYGFPPSDVLVPALAQIIQAVHALPLFPKLVDFFDGIDAFIQIAKSAGVLAPSATVELFKAYDEIKARYPRHDPDVVSSHNDLNPNNLLFDGQKLWLIDWEASFQNDRYVDLALAANYYLPQEGQREALLSAYFGASLDDVKRARFFLMRQICRIFYGLIMVNEAASQRPTDAIAATTIETMPSAEFFGQLRAGTLSLASYEGKVTYGKIMLSQAMADIRTPRFNESLNLMP